MPSTRTLLIGLLVVLVLGVAGAAFAGCTTIQINEEDVFLPKPSITPATFSVEGVTLTEYMVQSPAQGAPRIASQGASQRPTQQAGGADGAGTAGASAPGGGGSSARPSMTTNEDAPPRSQTVGTRPGTSAPDSSQVSPSGSSEIVQLNAWHLTRPDARGTVLFFGGNGFYLVQSRGYVEALTDFPVNVVLFDYRGYGKSTGEPAVEAFKGDALRMYDFAVDSLGADPDRMIVHGHSLGTFMASHTARERSVAGVVLENPATDVEGWIDGLAPWFVRLFVDFDIAESLKGESNLRTVRSLDVPLLVLAGEEDQVTRPDMARTLHEEAVSSAKQLVVVDSMGHNHLYRDGKYRQAYRSLLDRAFR
jgi:hypothetical protein